MRTSISSPIPEARELAEHPQEDGNQATGEAVLEAIQAILDRPEHAWYEAELKKPEAGENGPAAAEEAQGANTEDAPGQPEDAQE